MALTFTPIASTILSTTAATVTFSSISQSYTDLVLRYSMATNQATSASTIVMTMNGTNIGSTVQYLGNVGTNNSVGNILSAATGATGPASTFSGGYIYIKMYASSQQQKGFFETGGDAQSSSVHFVGAQENSAIIASLTSFTLTATGSFIANSRFDLYGILKA